MFATSAKSCSLTQMLSGISRRPCSCSTTLSSRYFSQNKLEACILDITLFLGTALSSRSRISKHSHGSPFLYSRSGLYNSNCVVLLFPASNVWYFVHDRYFLSNRHFHLHITSHNICWYPRPPIRMERDGRRSSNTKFPSARHDIRARTQRLSQHQLHLHRSNYHS